MKENMFRPGALMRLLRPVRMIIISCTLLSAIGSAAGIVPYIAIAELVQILLAGGNDRHVWLWVCVGAICAVLQLILSFFSSRLGHHADAKLLRLLRLDIVGKLREVPIGWFKSNGAASVNKAMTNDLEEMHMLIAHSIRELCGAAVGIIVAMVYLFSVSIAMSLIASTVLGLKIVFYCVAMRSQTAHQTRLLIAQGHIGTASVEYAEGTAVVKIFGAEGSFMKRFLAASEEFASAMEAWVDETRYSTAASYVLASDMTILGVMTAAGITLMAAGNLAIAELLPFLTIGIGLPSMVLPAIQGAQGIRSGRVTASRIESILNLEPLPIPHNPHIPTLSEIEFKNVIFKYDKAHIALDGVNAVLRPGTVTALVGPSGAGKTTMANLLPRFYDVSAGAISIGGVDVRDIPQEKLLSMMTLVFQDVILFNDSVLENIRIGKPGATDEEVFAAAQAANIHHVIEAMPERYDTVIGSDGDLSGGERQRLTIARAILADAPIVILDEATASLDADNEVEVQKALTRLSEGKTLMVIAHHFGTIKDADQILVLNEGRVVERGTHGQLLEFGGLYAEMWREQATGGALPC
jgi:ATP-binding cassette subfamily B protein